MSSASPVFQSVIDDPELIAEIQSRSKRLVLAHREALDTSGVSLAHTDVRSVLEGNFLESPEDQAATEAIILLEGRPSLLIQDDAFAEPELDYWKTRLMPYRSALQSVIRSVGRIELTGHATYQWVGTAWVLSDRLVATNRHVARIFAQRTGQGFVFRLNELGRRLTARVDFKEEYERTESREVPIARVLYIAPDEDGQPDMAVLELDGNLALPSPLRLAGNSAVGESPIAVIGYPAHDSRNGEDAMRDIFGPIYDVKRFAPGYLMQSNDPISLQHDCSTLGGNSGSAVVHVESGEVIGLHFGGRFRERNFAVKAEIIRSVLGRVRGSAGPGLTDGHLEGPTVASLAGREGYRADFLGTGKRVRLPDLTPQQEEDAVPVPNRSDFVLAYTHFSVVMCKSRRLCYFTAVNIDGEHSLNLRRTGSWALDPRIPASAQIGNEVYSNNNLDRGHMVRRLDPVWGPPEIAKQANNDTFMFTNACPQHARLNQGIWNDLEDYLLNNTAENQLKVSVFTGPVFGESDPFYRGVRLPQDFWKVAVMIKPGGELSATGYMQTQKPWLDDLEAPDFVFGQFRTYQVPLHRIEALTGLGFGTLKNHDPLNANEAPVAARSLRSVSDIIL
jgi:endonuclease G